MKDSNGMTKLTAQETQLIERLRQQPEMLARVQSIFDLAHAADGPLKSADEVEELLIRELRELGRSTMNQWASWSGVVCGSSCSVRAAMTCDRHVLQVRLKKAGTAWLRDHADQIAHRRVLRANDPWSSIWN